MRDCQFYSSSMYCVYHKFIGTYYVQLVATKAVLYNLILIEFSFWLPIIADLCSKRVIFKWLYSIWELCHDTYIYRYIMILDMV